MVICQSYYCVSVLLLLFSNYYFYYYYYYLRWWLREFALISLLFISSGCDWNPVPSCDSSVDIAQLFDSTGGTSHYC